MHTFVVSEFLQVQGLGIADRALYLASCMAVYQTVGRAVFSSGVWALLVSSQGVRQNSEPICL